MNENNIRLSKESSKNGQSGGLPWWLWVFLTAITASLLLGGYEKIQGFTQRETSVDPFLKVTNRQFSLFLWQFPEYMKINSPKKMEYLTGFLSIHENFSLEAAEEYVKAPDDLLFLYHTWSRLLFSDPIERPIPPDEFKRFLIQLPEWLPKNWTDAPQQYVQLVDHESYLAMKNLQVLPMSTLPIEVRTAFLGWKNYFVEGAEINATKLTYAELLSFLEKHPTYQRSFWRNISEMQGQKIAGLTYLSSLLKGGYAQDSEVPREQLSSFLIVAYHNAKKAAQNL